MPVDNGGAIVYTIKDCFTIDLIGDVCVGDSVLIDIRALQNGESVEFSESLSLNVPGAYCVIGSKAVVRAGGKALRHGGDYTVLAICEVDYELECARCLKPVRLSLSFPLEDRFRDNPEYLGDTDAWPLNDRFIDLTAAVESAFYSLIPSKALCSEDCEGINVNNIQ